MPPREQSEERAFNVIFDCIRTGATYSASFMDVLDALVYFWNVLGDDFELANKEGQITTNPLSISFDELMEGCCDDN